jgi:hypothetical protein
MIKKMQRSELLGRLSWSETASSYDFGRPFPGEVVYRLFEGLDWKSTPLGHIPETVFEPGIGTGRVLVPLARLWPSACFFGVDNSPRMLDELHRCIDLENITNLTAKLGDITRMAVDEKIDLILFSSVLHAIPSWKEAISRSLESAHDCSLVALVGEEADMYNLALGRTVTAVNDCPVDPGLSHFWRVYQDARHDSGALSAETSQVGVKWEIDNTEVAEHLIQRGFSEVLMSNTHWEIEWSLADMLAVVEHRCFSSIFTLTKEQHTHVMNVLLGAGFERESVKLTTRHQARVRIFGRANRGKLT